MTHESLDLRDLAEELEKLENLGWKDEEDNERLTALRGLQEQLFTNSLAKYAENESTLILERDFKDYAREFADAHGYASDNGNPLSNHIDWKGWADDLKQDYVELTFDGYTYLIRAY